MKCDSCGAPIENGKCSYCGKVFEEKKVNFTNVQSTNPSWTFSNSGTTEKVKQSFLETAWFCILMLFFFFPVGLYLMWHYKKFNSVVRIIITVFFIIAIFMNLAAMSGTTSAMAVQTLMFHC